MGLGRIGISSLILVFALLIFGPKKLPEIGSALGQTLKELNKSTSDLMSDQPDSKETTSLAKELV